MFVFHSSFVFREVLWFPSSQDILTAGFPKFELRGTPEDTSRFSVNGNDRTAKQCGEACRL